MEVKDIIPTGKFTKAQLDLLKLFSREMPEENWIEIKTLISKYFAEKASDEMDKLFEENGWGEEKIEEWSKEHMRTPYK
ncbi:hypothetical protein [Parafilimonas terrae]|jgi:hypothetical protein|uniref:Uncharacterized protein n=1 Tax=Parafilimonas terrae TaxID=1465490 RepID=A0A1I5WCG0_9BACT|nr:hypothetical protein [Parafilimonas terrae]SFQ17335.1 hypothetical protein SAMN05444277_10690 [Parafilimonas terrae]